MKYLRLIPKLDIKGNNLVKGIHLEGLRVLGDPSKFAEYYAENGADEIIYNDVVASLYGRNNILDLISKTASNCSIPITVCGGIRNIDDIKKTLKSGADKIAINTAAIENINFIESAVKIFGSSTIVINIEASFYEGSFRVFTNNGRERTPFEVKEWLNIIQDKGAGEVMLTSIDNEGTGNGFNIRLIENIYDSIRIPLILHGGARDSQDIIDVKKRFDNIEAFGLSSILHYNFIRDRQNENNHIVIGNTSFLKSNKKFKNFGEYTIKKIKNDLIKNNIYTRHRW